MESDSIVTQSEKSLYALDLKEVARYVWKQPISFWSINLYMLFEYVRPQSIYSMLDGIPFSQISLIATVGSLLIEGSIKRVKNPMNTMMVLFALLIFLSSAFAYDPAVSFAALKEFFVWFAVYFLIVQTINTENRFFVFLLAFILYNAKMTQHGFLSWAKRGFSFTEWGVSGAPGWFHNSGEFGIQLCIFLPVSICWMISLWPYWDRFRKMIFALLPITAVGSVLATSSRGALLGVFGSMTWLAATSKKARGKALLAVVAVAIVSFVAIPDEFVQRFETMGEDRTSARRLERWYHGIDMMNENPVLGVGYRNWMEYYTAKYSPRTGHGLSHNIFIEAGSEMGYTGLFLFLAMIVLAFLNNLRTRRAARAADNRFVLWTAFGFDAALVGFLISAFFITVLYYPYFWIHIAFIVSLSNVAQQLVPVAAPASSASSHRNAAYG